MPTELKPCPFCGGEAVLVRENKSNEGHLYDLAAIKCRSCACNSGTYLIDIRANTETAIQRLINAWNKRTQPDGPEIIHCRDCVYFTPIGGICEYSRDSLVCRFPDEFCSRGTPRYFDKGEKQCQLN